MSAVPLLPQRFVNLSRGLLALAGLTIALMGSDLRFNIFNTDNNSLVSVNQQPISLQQLNFAAQRLTGASADSLDAKQKNTIIKLLIDEEVLLQRAESLDIAHSDPGIRKALARAVINQTADDFLTQTIAPQQLQDFYLEHKTLFAQPERIQLQVYKFAELAMAQQAIASNQSLTDQGSVLPPSALPIHMLRRYLGNSLTDIALTLEAGEKSQPISQPDAVYVLNIIDRQPQQLRPFEQIRSQVEAEYRRRGRDTALQTQLAALRQQAKIIINHRQRLEVGDE